MKTLYFLLFLIPLTLFAQEPHWFEAGSTWTYNYQTFANTDHHQATYGITEMTCGDRPCVKMEPFGSTVFMCLGILPPMYFYESNDSIFYSSSPDGTFRLAYDFNAVPGDSWTFIVPSDHINAVDTFNVSVQNVNPVMIDGHTIKELQLEYTNISTNPTLFIYPEEVSVLKFAGAIPIFFVPFGEVGACDNEIGVTLQCFDSPSFSYVNPEFGTCLLSAPSEEDQPTIQIYPNPATDILTVESPDNEKGTLRILQLDGKVVFEKQLHFATETVNLPSIGAGMYIVEVKNAESRFYEKLQIE